MAKKVLVLTPFFPPNIGGAETFCEALVNEMKHNFGVTVLTYQPFNFKINIYEENYYYDEYNYDPKIPYPQYKLKGYLKIYRLTWPFKQGNAWQGTSFKNLLAVLPKMLIKAIFLQRKEKFDVIYANGIISTLVAIIVKRLG